MSMRRVREIIKDAGYGLLASSIDGQPRLRPHAFVLLDDGRLWTSTWACSGKVRELELNPLVELCFVDSNKVQLRIEGRAVLSGGPDKKRELLELNPRVGRHFKDENDPNYVHIEIIPSRIRFKPAGFGEYQEVKVDESN
ncbi:MAG: pyridoxamine 5'-phosphate oxidase family protein [Myxococcota bacterium]|jgi:general stress protein 26|nr:pyridoxamine 5'-phosphate oxidase family protein [Myxococcota bacterium]